MSKIEAGIALAMANVVIGALQPVITGWAAQRVEPMLFCGGGTLIALLCALPLLGARGEIAPLLRGPYVGRLVGISLFGSVATTLALTYGLRRLNVVTAVLLLQTEPIYALALGALLRNERPSSRQLLATAVIGAGIGSVFWGGHQFPLNLDALLIVLTPLMWQLAHSLSLGAMPPLSPYCITGARFFYGSIVLVAATLIVHPGSLAQMGDPATLAVIVLSGVVVYFLGSLAWYGAINRLSLSWTTALVVPGVPLLSVIFAKFFLGEAATLGQWIGILIAIGGIVLLVLGAASGRAIHPEEAVHHPLG